VSPLFADIERTATSAHTGRSCADDGYHEAIGLIESEAKNGVENIVYGFGGAEESAVATIQGLDGESRVEAHKFDDAVDIAFRVIKQAQQLGGYRGSRRQVFDAVDIGI